MRKFILILSGLLVIVNLANAQDYTVENNASEGAFQWPEGKQMALSLTFDDARFSQVEKGIPLLNTYGVSGTFYVSPGAMLERVADWKKAVEAGHEIGNHTMVHPCSGNFPWARHKALEDYTLEKMAQELDSASTLIHQVLGIWPTAFAYTCGQTYVGRGVDTRSYVPLVAERFETGRNWMNEGPNDPSYCDLARLNGTELDGKSFEEALKYIEAAREQGAWLVFAGHEMDEGGRQTVLLPTLDSICRYASDPANGIWLDNVSEIGKYVRETRGMAQRPQPTANDSLFSTEILPGNRVAFRIYAPEAEQVNLRSDDKWDPIEFKKDSRGVWEGIWTDVKPGAYRYRFVVDGITLNDPKGPSAREDVAILMMTEGDEFFAMKDDVPHGAIAQRFYYSKALNKTRRLHVWTPAGYELLDTSLPVLYLIHGGGDVDNAWTSIGCAGNILDNLLAEGKIEPMIVVMPNGSVEVDTPIMLERVFIFNEDLMTSIIPFVESNYRVHPGASHRAIMGLSFGGLETLEAVLSQPQDFRYVGVLSSGWWISDAWQKERGWMDDKEKRATRLMQIADDLNKSVKLLYFTQGGPEDLAYENGQETMKLFTEAGIKYKYREIPGGHTWMVWRQDLLHIAPMLFK